MILRLAATSHGFRTIEELASRPESEVARALMSLKDDLRLIFAHALASPG